MIAGAGASKKIIELLDTVQHSLMPSPDSQNFNVANSGGPGEEKFITLVTEYSKKAGYMHVLDGIRG